MNTKSLFCALGFGLLVLLTWANNWLKPICCNCKEEETKAQVLAPNPEVNNAPMGNALAVMYKENSLFSAAEGFRFAESGARAEVPAATQVLLDSIRAYAKRNPGQSLEITGFYKNAESNKTTFKDLGIARADSVRRLINPEMAAILKSQVKNDLPVKEGFLYNGIAFNFVEDVNAGKTGGLTTEELQILRTEHVVYFKTGSSTFAQDAENDKFFNLAKKYLAAVPSAKVAITGHTDNQGDAAKNKELSVKRAGDVKTELAKLGINEAQISTAGKGQEDPIADNESEEGRQLNRRAEIIVE